MKHNGSPLRKAAPLLNKVYRSLPSPLGRHEEPLFLPVGEVTQAKKADFLRRLPPSLY